MPTVLIKNGRIVTAVDDYQADILIEDGRIRIIGQGRVAGNSVKTHDAIRGSARSDAAKSHLQVAVGGQVVIPVCGTEHAAMAAPTATA